MMYIARQQISISDYIDDYIEFGIFNGLYSVNAYLAFWDIISEKARKIRMAKLIAEYGRAIEEVFAHIYAMAKQAHTSEYVFWDCLVDYTNRQLADFIRTAEFGNISKLLNLSQTSILAEELRFNESLLLLSLEEASCLLNDIRLEYMQDNKDEEKGKLQRIYYKLKHPCLIFSNTPEGIEGFGVMQATKKENPAPFEFIPVSCKKDDAIRIFSNIRSLTYTLMLLLKCFKTSYKIREKQ